MSRKKKFNAKIGKIHAVFSKKFTLFVVEICVYFVFFKELYAYLPKKFAFVFQGNLHLFSMEFALTFHRNFALVSSKSARVFR